MMHGGMDQYDREFTLYDYKNKKKNIMVATSIVARGMAQGLPTQHPPRDVSDESSGRDGVVGSGSGPTGPVLVHVRGHVVQLSQHMIPNQKVLRSNPRCSTRDDASAS